MVFGGRSPTKSRPVLVLVRATFRRLTMRVRRYSHDYNGVPSYVKSRPQRLIGDFR